MFLKTFVGLSLLVFVININRSYAKSLKSSDINDSVNLQLVNTMMNYMDLSTNPCKNFYQYACGNWEVVHRRLGFLNYVDTIGSLEFQIKKQFVNILEKRISIKKTERNDVYRKVREFYEACRIHQEKGFQVNMYMAVLQQRDGLEWPSYLDEENGKWEASKWNWLKTLGVLRAYGLNHVLLVEELRYKNGSNIIMELDKPAKLDWGTYGKAYIEKMRKSSSPNDIQMSEKLQRLNEKLKTLNEGLSDKQMRFEMSLSELQKRLEMTTEFEDYFTSLLGEPIDSETVIVVASVTYLRKLKDLIAKTPKETIATYIKVRLLSHLFDEMPGTSSNEDCIGPMTRHMTLALDYIYDREIYQYERQASDAVILKIFERLKEKFGEIINEHANDLRQNELDFLQKKISEMTLNIGNLPKNVGDSFFSDYYKNLDVQKNYFYWSHLNAMHHMVAIEHSKLKLPNSHPYFTFYTWSYPSPAYVATRNLLIIPFAYMRQPIYDKYFHELFLFAELGNTLGHEIIHGFDTTGITYDSLGNPDELLAGAFQVRDHFKSSLECLQQEHTHSLDEKMADFSGFRLAFESHFHRANPDKFQMADVELTNKQLFFVKFAQFFCAVSEHKIVYDGSHDTPFLRVPQVVWNYGEFAKEFNCSGHMNSENVSRWKIGKNICQVW